jgi:2-oxoglutarate dehydrogenase E1 component
VCSSDLPAQLFHLLRRQARHRSRAPLVLFTPKSQLRTVASPIEDLTTGRFHSVLGDVEGRRRVVLCSGKVYADLLAARGERDVAIIRVEQLYPFPEARLREELARHPGADVVWCQEEPANMGAWPTFAMRFAELGLPVAYAGRKASAAPATGYPERHATEQRALVAAALG